MLVNPGFPDLSSKAAAGAKLSPAEVCARGEAWLERSSHAMGDCPAGTVIAVDLGTGAFVKATSGLEAMDLFEETFGTDAQAWVHQIGVPISGGSGIWPR